MGNMNVPTMGQDLLQLQVDVIGHGHSVGHYVHLEKRDRLYVIHAHLTVDALCVHTIQNIKHEAVVP